MREPPARRVQTICLLVLSAATVIYFIYWLRPVLVPFVVSVFVVCGVEPILQWLEQRLSVNRLVAAAITFLVGLMMIVVFAWLLVGSVLELANNAGAYRERVRDLTSSVEEYIPQRFLGSPETPAENENENVANGAATASREKADTLIDSLISNGIAQVSSALTMLVSTTVVVLIYVFFLLLGTPATASRPPAWDEIERQIRSYLGLKTFISIVTGVAFGATLHLFEVPMATTFGVLAFLLNYIPNIGPIVASVLPVPLIVLHPEATWWWAILVIGITSGIQIISGSLVEPKMMGESSDLHPVVVLLALMFWGMMWGIVGMFLATPITALVKIILSKYETTHNLAEMMAGRWQAAKEPAHL